MRYRIAQNPAGRHIVLAAPLAVVAIDHTYASRADAQAETDWLNSLAHERQEVPA